MASSSWRSSLTRGLRRAVVKCDDPKEFYQRHHEILNLKLMGMHEYKIAEIMGVSTRTVNRAVTSTLGTQKLAVMRGARDADTIDVAKEIARLVPKALEIYETILEGEQGASIALRKQTADTIVKDLAGHAAPKRIEGRFAHAHALNRESIEAIKSRGRKAADELGILVSETGT